MAAPELNDAPEVAESKGDLPVENEGDLPEFQALVGMLEMVAFKRRKVGKQADTWVEEVRAKFEDVGMTELRDFVHHVLVLNRRLANNGHQELNQSTLNLMLREVGDMMFGLE